jgi:hypothetical protein
MHSSSSFRVLPLLAVLAASGAMPGHRAQAPRVLDKPQVELAEPFTNVSNVRELSDGRVIVIDNGDRAVYVVDFKAGTSTQIGRPGSGPAEYRSPALLLAADGDTTLLTDPGNNRLLVIAPDAQPVGVLTEAWPLPDGRPGTRLPRALDGRGRGYFTHAPANQGTNIRSNGEMTPLDSVVLARAGRGSAAEEAIGYVHLSPRRISTTSKDGKLTSVEIRTPPLPAQDAWQVFADGAVAIARVADYRVDWVLPDGRRVPGRPIGFTRIRVTEADKKTSGAGPGTSVPNKPPEIDWPEFKPPFSHSGVLAAPDGRLWVPRYGVAADPRTHYDIVDRRGVVVAKADVPSGGRVVGFGARSIYVVRKDADDLQYLQRFALN